jgi:hypothetical protein
MLGRRPKNDRAGRAVLSHHMSRKGRRPPSRMPPFLYACACLPTNDSGLTQPGGFVGVFVRRGQAFYTKMSGRTIQSVRMLSSTTYLPTNQPTYLPYLGTYLWMPMLARMGGVCVPM